MSDEVRKLALEYWHFSEDIWVKRTQGFMEVGDNLKAAKNEIEELMKTIQSGRPFSSSKHQNAKSGWDVIAFQRTINQWSCESLFQTILEKASEDAKYIYTDHKNRPPNVRAGAWLEYFTAYDETTRQRSANQNWKEYYNQYYQSKLTES